MLRLKKFDTETITLEQRIEQLDVLIAAMESNDILAAQQRSGLLNVGLESSFLSTENFAEKTKQFLQELWKNIRAFFAALWEKFFGDESIAARSESNAKETLALAKKELSEPAEIPESEQDDVEEFKRSYAHEGKDAPVPKGLPENLYKRLASSHETMFNVGVCAFANTHLRDQNYTAKLMNASAGIIKATVEYLRKQSKTGTSDSEPGSDTTADRIVDPFESYIKNEPSWKTLIDLTKETGVEYDGYEPRKLLDVRNAITTFVIPNRIPLDMDKNKAFTHGNKQLESGIATLANTISVSNKERAKGEATVKRVVREMQQIEVDVATKRAVMFLSDMGNAYAAFARMRVMYSEHNANYLRAVLAVNRHYARKKGK